MVVVVNRMDAKTHTHTHKHTSSVTSVVVVASGNFFAYYYCLLPYFSLSCSPRFLFGGGGGNSMNSLKMMQTECRLKN